MKTKFCVFNDRKIQMNLQVQNAPDTDLADFRKIAPITMAVMDIEIPDGAYPYLKIWENEQALLSYIWPESL